MLGCVHHGQPTMILHSIKIGNIRNIRDVMRIYCFGRLCLAARLLCCSLRDGLDNIRRSWKREKRWLTEAVSCHMDDVYFFM